LAVPVLAEIQPILDLLNSVEPPPPPKDEAELLARMRATIGMMQEPVNETLAVASVEDKVIDFHGLEVPVRVYTPANRAAIAAAMNRHNVGFDEHTSTNFLHETTASKKRTKP
jgi:hypothetical protein